METLFKKLILLIVGAFCLTLSACTLPFDEIPITGSEPTPAAQSGLASTNWRLNSYGQPGAETQVLEVTVLSLEFDGGVKAGGFGGCNMFGAEYQTNGDQLSIGGLIATEIACMTEGVMNQELQFFNALQSADRFEVSGDELKIWYEGGQKVLNFSRLTTTTPVPSTPLDTSY